MIKKPEPVAYLRKDELKRLGVPATTGMSVHQVSDSLLLRAKATKELAEKYGHSVPVVTTEQAEAYAAERVREALEQAAQTVLDGIDDDSSIAALAIRRNAAEEILSLIHKE